MAEVVNAKQRRLGKEDALALLAGVDDLWSMRGKKVVHADLAHAPPARAALLALLLGPTGNLRAPAIRKGRTLIVGFDGETYRRLFG